MRNEEQPGFFSFLIPHSSFLPRNLPAPAALGPSGPAFCGPDARREAQRLRKYECMYILDPGLTDEQQEPLMTRFQTLIGENGGAVEGVDKWERRRLAYEVKGKREGVYVVMNFSGEPATEAELGRVLGITEGVLRHLVIRTDTK
jgi:small subunit ribosomal protein S6